MVSETHLASHWSILGVVLLVIGLFQMGVVITWLGVGVSSCCARDLWRSHHRTNHGQDHVQNGQMTRSQTRQLLSNTPRSEEVRYNSGKILAKDCFLLYLAILPVY